MNLTIEGLEQKTAQFSKIHGQFGIPLVEALSPKMPAKVTFEGKAFEMGSSDVAEAFDPFEDGFSIPRSWAQGCLGWIWCQWLSKATGRTIQKEVEFVVERGMEMQEKSENQNYRCLHDLWLLNCAILASGDGQLKKLASSVIDSNGDKRKPLNNGELFSAAWCGMLKYWILGDAKKAAEQYEIAGVANREEISRAAPKSLVAKWLAGDWKSFAGEQRKDFKTLWERAKKDEAVISKDENEVVIVFNRIPLPGRGWCWSHNGLAMLAHRRGVEIATDSFWLPAHALTCVG